MIILLVLFIHFVATSPESSLSRNVTNDLRNNACTYRRHMDKSVVNLTPNLNNPENPAWLAFDTTDLPALKRGKRQNKRSTTLSPEEQKKKAEEKRIDYVKEKALRLMAQAMYATQELIWPMEKIFKSYEADVPYRMAYIFLKMQTIMKEAHSIVHVLEQRRNNSNLGMLWSPTKRVQMYWQLVRKNMDVTYLVDYIIERVPLGTEAVDTTVPPTTTAGPNTTSAASTNSTTTASTNTTTTASTITTTTASTKTTTTSAHDITTTRRKLRLRTAYFRRNFEMPAAYRRDNKIRAGVGKDGFARPVKRKVKKSTP